MDLFLLLFIIVVPLIAQSSVKSAYEKYLKVINSSGLTGEQIARKILDQNGLTNVKINSTSGLLSDNYNPKNKSVNLSNAVYHGNSIASAAIAAHECGHAIQDKEAYSFLRFRNSMVPAVNFTSKIAPIFIILGLLLSFLDLLAIGIILMMGGLIFELVTLPVEFNASSRARVQLKNCGLLAESDVTGTDKVLKAAAYTYVAGFLASTANLLRLILLNRNRR